MQYRVNGGSWVAWKQETTETSGTIQSGANGNLYEFRARAVDEAGNVQAFSAVQASTRVDTLPPAVAVRDMDTYTFTSSFFVYWDGSDNLSGIESFDAQWRQAGGVWQTLVENTALRSFEFTGAQNGVTYEFRARARDRVGNVQPYSDQAQAQTTVVTHPIATVLPFDPVVLKSTAPITDTFTVSWQFVSGPTTPDETRIFYRYDGGAWQLWDVFDYPQLNALFHWENMGLGDGVYEFEAVAINTIGQVEPQAQKAEATIWVDMADVVHPRAYLPSVVRGP
ncbi:MAG TPA: fibronectin type III domain-containing protein [Candidatus Sulfomarinibacteraceae bacterium]|nr:fibronectin type III domain-containing protein [Candidatus Sulfomarinibacteraceae bacterium]